MQTSTIFFSLRRPDRFRQVSSQILTRMWFDSPISLPGCNWIWVLRSRPHFSLSIILQSSAVKDAVSKKTNSSHLPPFFLLSHLPPPTSHLSFCSPLGVFLCILDAGPDSHTHTHAHTYTHCSSLSLGSHIVCIWRLFPWLRFIFLFSFIWWHTTHIPNSVFSLYMTFPLPPPKKKVGKSNLKNTSVINREPNSMPCLLTWFALSFFRLDFSH